MTSKSETVLDHIGKLNNSQHSKLFLEFYDWFIEDQDNSPRNASTYLKILRLFSIDIETKPLDKITKDDVVTFLDKRKKTLEMTLYN